MNFLNGKQGVGNLPSTIKVLYHQIITLFAYHLIEELMKNATFCCLFHEIISSTLRDIKDFAKFQTVKFLGGQYANLFMTSLNDKIHFEPPK
jgi:hypothetical protein